MGDKDKEGVRWVVRIKGQVLGEKEIALGTSHPQFCTHSWETDVSRWEEELFKCKS